MTCGTGEINRRVWCPEGGFCNPNEKPTTVETCSKQPCLSWVAGSWSRVSFQIIQLFIAFIVK